MKLLSEKRRRQIADILRASLCLVGTLIFAFACVVLLSSWTSHPIALSVVPLLVASIAVTWVAVALHAVANWKALGLGGRRARCFGKGLLLGSVACALLVGGAVLLGLGDWTEFDAAEIRFDWRTSPLTGLALLTAGAAGEELFMRGLLLQYIARAVGPLAGVLFTSSAFALLHGANPSVTALAQVNTALFGAVFGLAVLRHRSLWLATGLHLGWNLAQVSLGADTSGITMRLTELNLELRGEEWLSGGEYGLEGGVLATAVGFLLAAALWRLPGSASQGRLLWETPDDPSGPLGERPGAGPLGTAAVGTPRRGQGQDAHGRREGAVDPRAGV